jgi:hypothetical protein
MQNKITKFLQRVARPAGFEIYNSIYGKIRLENKIPITQSSGAVYGIWVYSEEIPNGIRNLPGHTKWYPVYWGKDISPVSRMKAHVQGHQNGNINLPSHEFLRSKELIYGAVLVSSYRRFEQFLHERYKPMLGTNRRGSISSIIEIEN